MLLLFNVPWVPGIGSGIDMDAAWILTLHHAFANGWHWGSDIVWHYGPLGFLFGKYYHPDTYGWLVALWLFFSLMFWAGLAWLWTRLPANPSVPIAAAAIAVMTDDVMFLSFSVMLVVQYFWGDRRLNHPAFWVLLALCALCGWFKSSYLTVAVLAVSGIEVHRMMQEKIPGAVAVPFALMAIAFWLLLGQRLEDLLPYLKGAWELSQGFDTMTVANRPFYYAFLFLGLGGAWLLAVGQVLKRRKLYAEAVGWWVATLPMLLIVMKIGFINDNDHHILQALGWFFILALLTKDYFWRERSMVSLAFIGMFTLVAGATMVASYAVQSGAEAVFQYRGIKGLMTKGVQDGDTDFSTSDFFSPQKHYAKMQEEIRKKVTLPQVQGNVDLYEYYQDVLFAQSPVPEYRPRPVVQSYHVYSSYLARLNRDFLKSERAPEHIFFAIDNFAKRFPAMEDGLSWPELLTRYDMRSLKDGYLQLQKAASPREYHFSPIIEKTAGWGESVDVPQAANGLVWAKVVIRPSWRGVLIRAAFRMMPVRMRITLASGYARSDRISPDVMQEGFLLSPLVDNVLHFSMLGTEEQQLLAERNRVARIEFGYDESEALFPHAFFEKDIEVRFYQLELPVMQAKLEGWEQVKPYAMLSMGMPAQPADLQALKYPHIQFQQQEGQAVVTTFNGAALELPLPAGASHISLETSSYRKFGNIHVDPGAVELKIEGKRGAIRDILWQSVIPEAQRGVPAPEPLHPDLTWEPGKFESLLFTSMPQSPLRYNWIYWKDVKID